MNTLVTSKFGQNLSSKVHQGHQEFQTLLTRITAKRHGIPIPTSVKPSEGQTVTLGPGPSMTPGWRPLDQLSPLPPTSAAGTVQQGILQEFVFLWELIND